MATGHASYSEMPVTNEPQWHNLGRARLSAVQTHASTNPRSRRPTGISVQLPTRRSMDIERLVGRHVRPCVYVRMCVGRVGRSVRGDAIVPVVNMVFKFLGRIAPYLMDRMAHARIRLPRSRKAHACAPAHAGAKMRSRSATT